MRALVVYCVAFIVVVVGYQATTANGMYENAVASEHVVSRARSFLQRKILTGGNFDEF